MKQEKRKKKGEGGRTWKRQREEGKEGDGTVVSNRAADVLTIIALN